MDLNSIFSSVSNTAPHSSSSLTSHPPSTFSAPAALATTTIYAIIYVSSPAPNAIAPCAIPPSSSSKNSTLEAYAAGQDYSNYSFTMLGASFSASLPRYPDRVQKISSFFTATVGFSTIILLLILVTGFSCILIQAQKMKRVIEDDGSSSESSIGLGRGGSDPEMELLFPGEKMGERKGRRGKKRSERQGLLRQGEPSYFTDLFWITLMRWIRVFRFDNDEKR